MSTFVNKQNRKNSINFIEKNSSGPIKLQILLNPNTETKIISNYSYILRSHRPLANTNINNHENQAQKNNRNSSLKIKPTNIISSSKTFHNKKGNSDNIINYLIKHSSKIPKKAKSIKINSKKEKLTNLLSNKISKDSLINLLSFLESSKTRKNSTKLRTNNNNIIYNTTDLKKSYISKKPKRDFIPHYTDFNINDQNEKTLTNSEEYSRKNLYDKFENIKLKTGDLLGKYQNLVESLQSQLKIERCKIKLENNYSYRKYSNNSNSNSNSKEMK